MAKTSAEKRPAAAEWLSVEQVAEMLAVPWGTVYRWARDGDPRLPAYKVWDERAGDHGRFRFKKSDVEAFQALLQEQSSSTEPR